MKRFRIFTIVLLAFCLGLPSAWAQNTSTQGKEFWLAFMHNGFKDHANGGWVTNQVLISAKRDCTGHVTNPLTGWSQEFSVRANNITTIEIPETQGYHNGSQHEVLLQKGIKVTATDTISVYCTNIAHVSFDASFVLPIESLGDEYIIQSYDQSTDGGNYYVDDNETTCFLIVATEDNTEVEITPTVNTLGGHTANQPFTITMNAGETYQVRSIRYGNERDLSGTHILAADCKRIAVFNGNTITCIPIDQGNGYDHVFEQAMPLRSWGKNFVVTSSHNRNRDFIKITSSANFNLVTMNGETLVTLREGQSYTFPMLESEGSCYLQTSQPSAVYLYNNSSYDQNFLGGFGDPSMVWIAPVEQRINEVTFSTFDHPNINIETHSVNIIVNTEDISNVYLDEQQVSPLLFRRVNGNNDYSYARLDISHGVHQITCENGFNAHVYGFGDAKGYAYLVGSNAKDLSSHLTINDEAVLPNESFPFCVDHEVTFNAEVNYSQYNLLWNFGDGTTSTDNPARHTYHDRRLYNASLAISTNEGGCTGTAGDTTFFYIDATQQYVVLSDETCEGELYSGHGFNNVRINNDTILARLEDNPIHNECQDSVLLYITAHPSYHIPIDDSRCWQGQPGIYDGYGFSFAYDHPGTYNQQLNLQTIHGCDSILNLHLIIDEQITHEFNHHECSGSYVWDGRLYSDPGDYEYTYVTLGGCDSIVTMHLTMGLPDYNSFDTITCGAFHWNGQAYTNSGTYTYEYTNSSGCPSVDTLHLTISGDVEGTTLAIDTCNSYTWFGTDYTSSGRYKKTLSTSLGCDSTVYLQLELGYTPNPTEIYPADPENTAPHWVITATEFQINSYDFQVWELGTAEWTEPIEWQFVKKLDNNVWVEDTDIQWILVPDSTTSPLGKKVRMFVLDYVEDTVWLAATVKNDCGEITRRNWFVSSFYGMEENVSTTTATFDIIPNPNTGQMTLNFEHWGGLVEVSVYDMHGTMVDRLQVESEGILSMPYQLSDKHAGIYCFVATGRNGTITKKVTITH